MFVREKVEELFGSDVKCESSLDVYCECVIVIMALIMRDERKVVKTLC